jgi:hypothetical protein
VTVDYFDATMLNRQRLLWAIATRRQLERWEPLVAAILRDSLARRPSDAVLVWSAEIEHHFGLIAAHHLLVALDGAPASGVPVDGLLRAELTDGRHLHEHWVDNMPVFNVVPRPAPPPRQSGRSFADRNPGESPYWWLGFDSKKGAMFTPKASAQELHRLLDAVETDVLASDSMLAEYVPPRVPSPWLHRGGEWWPKADDAEQPGD